MRVDSDGIGQRVSPVRWIVESLLSVVISSIALYGPSLACVWPAARQSPTCLLVLW